MGKSQRLLHLGGIGIVVILGILCEGLDPSPAAALALDPALGLPVPSLSLVRSPEPTPFPGEGMSPSERLDKPPISDPPTQIELGHQEYWMSCMVCHGDQGQGLTEEWRSVLNPADRYCWQARCHGDHHPPNGFKIPRTSPRIMGTGALSGYKTATELFEYLRVEMPWSYPGLFETEDYWQLTAYLADANGIDMGQDPLGPENGDEILLVPGMVQTHHIPVEGERIAVGVMAGLLLGSALLFWLIRAL
jgi:mono/diheme cytochrome c family protein